MQIVMHFIKEFTHSIHNDTSDRVQNKTTSFGKAEQKYSKKARLCWIVVYERRLRQ